MIKKISVIGLGKLGCSMAAVFAEKGFKVLGYDVDGDKVLAVNSGLAPVFETGLAELINSNRNNLIATNSINDAVLNSEISFMVVPTPSRPDGLFENQYAVDAAKQIGEVLKNKFEYHVVVLTSTVLPGVSRSEIISALEKSSGKKCGIDFGFCYSPEFIALGSVIEDLISPDYFLIGEYDARSGDALEFINCKVSKKIPTICRLTIEEAELAKIATNSFITMKISFANYMAAICEHLPNANVDSVTEAIGMDSRIGKKYLTGGLGFGGPCFPRDNIALAKFAGKFDIYSKIPVSVDHFNRDYSVRVAKRVTNIMNNIGSVGVVGLAYKPGSHVLEESASVAIVKALIEQGHNVYGYDQLQEEFENDCLPNSLILVNSLESLIQQVDAIILTHRDLGLLSRLENVIKKTNKIKPIFDCWRLIEEHKWPNTKLYQIGFGLNIINA